MKIFRLFSVLFLLFFCCLFTQAKNSSSLIASSYLVKVTKDTLNNELKKIKDTSTIDNDSLKLVASFNSYKSFLKNGNKDSLNRKAGKIIILCTSYFRKTEGSRTFYFDISEEFFLKNNDFYNLARLLNYKGIMYSDIEYLSFALRYYKESIIYFKKSEYPCKASFVYSNIGYTYMMLKDFDLANDYFKLSLDNLEACKSIYRKEVYEKGLVLTKTNIAGNQINLKNYKIAIEELSSILNREGFDEKTYLSSKLLVYVNYVICKGQLGDYTNLQIIKNGVLNINKDDLELPADIISYNQILGYLEGLEGNYDVAIEYFEKSISIADKKNLIFPKQFSYEAFIFVYNRLNNLKKVINYQNELLDLSKKKLLLSRQRNLQELDAIYKVQDIENEKRILSEQNTLHKATIELEKIKATNLSIFLIALAIVLFLIIVAFYYDKKKSKQLSVQNELIEKQRINLQDLYSKEHQLNNELEKSNETIRKTFSIISHDLRNPFNALLGYSKLLVEDYNELSEEEKISFIKTINKVSEDNFNLTQNLLQWSLKQHQGYKLYKTKCNLKEVIELCISSLWGFVTYKKIIIENNSDNIEVYIDKEVLLTILNNLLTNAIKFSNTNEKIVIENSIEEECFAISIKNKGKKISKEGLDEINNFLSNREKKENKKSLGFGLSIAKEMAILHNGVISFKSYNDVVEVILIIKGTKKNKVN